MKANTLQNSLRAAANHVILLCLCLLVVFPIVWAILTSFKPANEIFSSSFFANQPTLTNYTSVAHSLPVTYMMMNTLLMAICVTAGILIVSVCAAYAFAFWEFRGKNLLFLLFVGSLLIPGQVTIIPNYLLLAKLGWLNTLPGLIIPQLATGLGVFYLRQQFKSFPGELLDAAVIDGANTVRVLWSIVLPNMRAVLTALAIITFVQTWNEYFWPLLVTSDLKSTVIQVGLKVFLQSDGNAWGPLMAAATLTLLPILVLYALAQRQIIEAFVRSGIR